MRIFGFFLRISAIVFFVGLFIYFIGARALMSYQTTQFVKVVKKIPTMAEDTATYAQMCRRAPASSNESVPIAFQLRFIDSKSYAIEVVCSLIEQSPIIVDRGSLLPFISKVSGNSGFYQSLRESEPSSVTLQLLNIQKQLLLNGTVVTVSEPTGVVQTALPRTVCAGYGYECCALDIRKGLGNMQPNAIDCPSQCFTSCEAIPYVVAFGTEPPVDEDRRLRMEQNDLLVTFPYTVDSVTPLSKVTISYGDGQEETSTDTTGIFTHTFHCDTSCTFTVKIQAIDEQGRSSIENKNTTVYIER